MTVLAHALAAWLAWAPPGAHVAAWALLHQVPPVVALAAAEAETGAIPAPRRDAVVYRGNVGRLQVRMGTWCGPLGLGDRKTCRRALQRAETNAWAGTLVLAAFQARYAPLGPPLLALQGCRCRRPHAGGWTAHYNQGGLITAHGERYGARVLWHAQRLTRRPDRRW